MYSNFHYIKIDSQYYFFFPEVLDYYFFARLLKVKKKLWRD